MDTKRFLLNGFYAKISFLVIWVFLSSFFITPTVLAQTTDFAGGSGTISNPYQITNCIQLQNVKNHLSSNFILNNDVDCSDTINWNNGAGFEPIGSNLDNAFTGRFNGLSHIIYNLYINRPSTNNVGLFGYVRNQRNYIERVGFSGASILGNYNVGILAGFGNYSSFSQSFSVGSLVKGVSRVGGLIGESYASNIYNSYSVSSSVIGFRPSNIYPGYVGGLVGSHSYGNVVNSYSANYVSNAVYFSYSYVGGLVGYLGTNGQISNSYRNLETSVSMVGGGGIPRNTDEMKQGSTFSGWMIESGSTWGISPSINDGYPYLKSFSLPSSPLNPILSAVGQENKRIILNWRLPFGSNSASYYIYGSDTPDFVPSIDNKIADIVFSSPYEDTVPVTGVLRFYKVVAVNPGGSSVSNEVSALSLMTPISTCAELQDIKNNLSGEYILVNNINCFETANWNQEAGFEPIMNFRGVFDGAGHIITDLYIDRPEDYEIGLFGMITNGGIVKNVGLHGAFIRGRSNVGSLAGYLVYGSNVSNSYAFNGRVIMSMNYGRGGGLVGTITTSGFVANSYSNNIVNGAGYDVRGLVGGIDTNGFVSNSYWDTQTSGKTLTGIGIGKTTEQMKLGPTFSGWDFDTVWGMDDSTNNGYPYLNSGSPILPPSIPTLSATVNALDPEFVSLSWDRVAFADFYKIYRGDTNDFNSSGKLKTLTSTDTSYIDASTSLGFGDVGRTFYYWVVATNSAGNSLPSDVVSVTVNPFTITNCQELQNIKNDLSRKYVLGNDIDCSDISNFEPIGTTDSAGPDSDFRGSLDGRGYKITGLNISRYGYYLGLFGYMSSQAVVKNLTIENATVNSSTGGSGYRLGLLAGYNAGKIIDVNVSGSVINAGNDVGGLVGYNASSGYLANVCSSVSIIGTGAGLVGRNDGTIENSCAEDGLLVLSNGGVIADSYATNGSLVNGNSGTIMYSYSTGGGLVVLTNTGTISDSYATGNVTRSGATGVGGLVGTNSGSILRSYATGAVKGFRNVGGLVGSNAGNIFNSYATGNVVLDSVGASFPGPNLFYAGGLVGGSSGVISNSYGTGSVSFIDSTGRVSEGGAIGGLVGQNYGRISNSYARGSANGTFAVGGLVGRNYNQVYSSYSTGIVIDSVVDSIGIDVGGLIGESVSTPETINSFWDTETSNKDISASPGGEGKTTSEMKTQSTFTNWDFDNIWSINSSINNGYPHLKDSQFFSVGSFSLSIDYTVSTLPLVIFNLTNSSGQSVDGIRIYRKGGSFWPTETVLNLLTNPPTACSKTTPLDQICLASSRDGDFSATNGQYSLSDSNVVAGDTYIYKMVSLDFISDLNSTGHSEFSSAVNISIQNPSLPQPTNLKIGFETSPQGQTALIIDHDSFNTQSASISNFIDSISSFIKRVFSVKPAEASSHLSAEPITFSFSDPVIPPGSDLPAPEGFLVYRQGINPITSLDGALPSCSDTNLCILSSLLPPDGVNGQYQVVDSSVTIGTEYYYTVVAIYPEEVSDGDTSSGFSVQVGAFALPPPPSTPTNLSATAGTNEISLSWDSDPSATSYQIFRGDTAGLTPDSNTLLVPSITTNSYTDTTAFADGGLSKEYFYKIVATNDGGDSDPSDEVSADSLPIAPGAPTITSATVGDGEVTLSWAAPTTGGPVIGYHVYPTKNGVSLDRVTISGTSLSTIFNNLENGATYTFEVSAYNDGGEGDMSNEVSATPLPPAPATLSYTSPNIFIVDQTISPLSPTVTGGQPDSYTVSPTTPLPDGLSIDSDGVISGIPTTQSPQDTYTVTATNAGGSTTFDISITVNLEVPNEPTNVEAFFYTNDELGITDVGTYIVLQWQAPSSGDVRGYKLYYSFNDNQDFALADMEGFELTDTITAIPISPLAPGETFRFKVSAYNDSFTEGPLSAQSNELSTPLEPSAPTNVRHSITKGSQLPSDLGLDDSKYYIVLRWDDSSNPGPNGYKIYTSTNNEDYLLFYRTDKKALIFTPTPGNTYRFKVSAYNNLLGVVEEFDSLQIEVAEEAVIPLAPQTAPSGINVSAHLGGVSRSWTALSGENVLGYHVYQSEDGGDFEFSRNVPYIDGQTVYDSWTSSETVSSGSVYKFKVSAYNYGGEGPMSAESQEAIPIDHPTGELVASDLSESSVTISWNAPVGATKYDVIRCGEESSPCDSEFLFTIAQGLVDLLYTDTGLDPDTTYTYQVRARNDNFGESFSVPLDVTTPEPTVSLPDAPGTPTVTATTENSITISWDEPTTGGILDSYNIYHFSNNIDQLLPTSNISVSVIGTTAIISGLNNENLYRFKVAGVNSAGEGPKSDPTDTMRPVRITFDAAYGGRTAPVEIKFLPIFEGIVDCQNLRMNFDDGTSVQTLDPNGSGCQLDLNRGIYEVPHFFQNPGIYNVKAMVGTAEEIVEVKINAVPSISNSPQDTVGVIGQPVSFSWTGSDQNIDDTLSWFIDWGDGTQPTELTGQAVTASHEWQASGSYEVKALLSDNISPFNVLPNDVFEITISDEAPGAPQNITATPGDTQAFLSWNAPSTGGVVVGYKVYQVIDGSSLRLVPTVGTGIRVNIVGTTATVSGLVNGASYTFKVEAYNTADGTKSVGESVTPVASTSSGSGGGDFGDIPTDGGDVGLNFSFPTITKELTPQMTLQDGEMVLARFSVKASPSGALVLRLLNIDIETSGVVLNRPEVKVYEDSGFSIPDSQRAKIIQRFISPGNILLGKRLQVSGPIIIPADDTKYIEVSGQMSRSTAGSFVKTTLLSDSESSDLLTVHNLLDSLLGNFVWSPFGGGVPRDSAPVWVNSSVSVGLFDAPIEFTLSR